MSARSRRPRDEAAVAAAEAAAHEAALDLAREVAGGGGGDDNAAAVQRAFPEGLAMAVHDSGGEVSASVEETNRCVHTSNAVPRDTTHATQLGCACLLSPTLATCASPCLVALDASTRVFGYLAPVSLTLASLRALHSASAQL
jgi:hypothetical protein